MSAPAGRRQVQGDSQHARLPSGVRRALLAVAAGFLLYAGHPPLGQGWVAYVALVPLLVLARDVSAARRPLRSGFAWGLLAGVTFFGPLLEWVRLVDVLALVLLVAYLSLFVGAYVGGLAAWGDRRGRAVAAVVWWVGLEALRGTVPWGGFPWGLLGYTQASGGPVLPVARVLGVLGVSTVLASTAVAVYRGWERGRQAWRASAAGRDERARGEAAAAAARTPTMALVGLLAAGVLLSGTAPAATGTAVDVAAVQGFDIEGSTGRSLPRSVVIADKMLETTRQAVDEGGVPQLTVWPENALDADIAEHGAVRDRVEAASDALDGGPLLAGMIVRGGEDGTWQNTVVQLEGSGEVDRYVKRRPVPFGEYIPLRPLVGWYPTIQRLRPTDAVAGTDPGVFDVAGARVGVVICFESIFPRLVQSQVSRGANLLVVVTNNSSFGRSALSDQHVTFSQVRAVESGRWVVHSALSGISALIDPDGVVHQRTGLYTQEVIRAEVPLVEGRTIASRLGEAPGWAAMGLSLLGLALLVRDTRRRRVSL